MLSDIASLRRSSAWDIRGQCANKFVIGFPVKWIRVADLMLFMPAFISPYRLMFESMFGSINNIFEDYGDHDILYAISKKTVPIRKKQDTRKNHVKSNDVNAVFEVAWRIKNIRSVL